MRERESVLGLDGYFLSRVTYHNITPGAARIYKDTRLASQDTQ